MIVAHLIGGNEVEVRIKDQNTNEYKVEKIRDGVVIINKKKLKTSYRELASVCGNISLDSLDTSVTIRRSDEDVQRDFIKLVQEQDEELGADFVIDNHLTKEVIYSHYEVDLETKTLTLKIDAYA